VGAGGRGFGCRRPRPPPPPPRTPPSTPPTGHGYGGLPGGGVRHGASHAGQPRRKPCQGAAREPGDARGQRRLGSPGGRSRLVGAAAGGLDPGRRVGQPARGIVLWTADSDAGGQWGPGRSGRQNGGDRKDVRRVRMAGAERRGAARRGAACPASWPHGKTQVLQEVHQDASCTPFGMEGASPPRPSPIAPLQPPPHPTTPRPAPFPARPPSFN
jgi:hypothetical protein